VGSSAQRTAVPVYGDDRNSTISRCKSLSRCPSH
jgi:hypothetical protein